MASIDSTGDARADLKRRFENAQRRHRISATTPFKPVQKEVPDITGNLYKMYCISSKWKTLPLRPVQFRPLITDRTFVPKAP